MIPRPSCPLFDRMVTNHLTHTLSILNAGRRGGGGRLALPMTAAAFIINRSRRHKGRRWRARARVVAPHWHHRGSFCCGWLGARASGGRWPSRRCCKVRAWRRGGSLVIGRGRQVRLPWGLLGKLLIESLPFFRRTGLAAAPDSSSFLQRVRAVLRLRLLRRLLLLLRGRRRWRWQPWACPGKSESGFGVACVGLCPLKTETDRRPRPVDW